MAMRLADLVPEMAARRRERRLSQPLLARELGVAQSTISRLESGALGLTLDIAVRIADWLGYDLIPVRRRRRK